MTARDLVMASSGAVPDKTYVEDVFSTYLYTGNGSSQPINNEIDLAGKGGMVMLADINASSGGSYIKAFDTVRGVGKYNYTAYSGSQTSNATYGIQSYNSNGFTVVDNSSGGYGCNGNGYSYASWVFRKAPKFFDVVTYTGTGTARTISHSLGSAPGMVIVKCTSTSGNWAVYHNGQTSASYHTKFNLFDAQAADSTVWNGTAPTSSVFSVGTSTLTNSNGETYVAYLFAHNTETDGMIQCGSFTTDSSSNATVSLGWEPQYLLVKNISGSDGWLLYDTMRGFAQYTAALLMPNTIDAESVGLGKRVYPTATGFGTANILAASSTYIYMAVRRGPMKTPTDGTKVFSTNLATANFPWFKSGFVTDLGILGSRSTTDKFFFYDRSRGLRYLQSNTTNFETATTNKWYRFNNGWWDASGDNTDYVGWGFKRAPGFFDIVCYSGTGSTNNTLNHNLGAAPELIIYKNRNLNNYQSWMVQSTKFASTDNYLMLNDTASVQTGPSSCWLTPTKTTFGIGGWGGDSTVNYSGGTYVAYLFASCPGVSKVGTFTTNGSAQTIDCGFTNGARFILAKCTNGTSNWMVWDTTRGIASSTDPWLAINSAAAELSGTDYITPTASGFTITSNWGSGGQYIYLAIA